MTIALLLKKFEPTTGKSKHILEVSRRLAERGVAFHLITNEVKWRGPERAVAHLRIHRLGGGQNALYLQPGRIAGLIHSIGADLLELHGGLSMTLFARLFARNIRVPMIVNIHSQPTDLFREWRFLSPADWRYDRKYIADVDDVIGLGMKFIGLRRFVHHPNIRAIIVPSRKLERAYVGLPNVKYLPSGANVEMTEPKPESAAVQNVLFFGRAVMVRGIDTLIDGFSSMAGRRPELRLQLFLLDDVDLDRIRQLVDQSPWCDRIELSVGRDERMGERLATATVAAFPFRSSGAIPEQPLTLIEAMAAGLPCVTTPIGTVGEIVQHEQNGLLVQPNDPARLAGAIGRLLDDPELRGRLGRDGQATVRSTFNWDTIAQQTLSLYERIAHSS